MFRKFLSLFILLYMALPTQALARHDGEHIYIQNCAACHGYNGNGGMGVPLSLPDFLATASNDYLYKTIRNGRPGRVMPAFKNLSDDDLDSLINYIRSWSNSIPPKYSNKTVKGDATHGNTLYQQHCAACHGESGTGGPGTGVTLSRPRSLPILAPALNNPGFLASASDEMIKRTLIKGRSGTPMVSFLNKGLSEQDINDIVAYVRSYETQDRDDKISKETEAEPAVVIVESPYTLKETVNNLKNAVSSMNFRLIRVQNLDSGLTKENEEDKKQVIIYSCNFNILDQALKLDPRVGLFLPCRVTVSQHGDKVHVMYSNPKRMRAIFNNSELNDMCTDMKTVYEEMIDEALL